MTIIDLSHVLRTGMAVYPGDPSVPTITRLAEHGPSSHQSSALEAGCHAGTHIDLPLHFKDGEQALEAYPLDRCWGRAVVVDAPAGEIGPDTLDGVDLAAADFVIFRTGWESRWGTPDYYADWPWLAADTARRLAAAGLKGVGIDGPSIDTAIDQTAHVVLAAAGFVNIENMANLGALPSQPFTLLILPLKLEGAEASPVRAAALIDGGR
jgi:kynurenine formamidase